MIFNRCLITLSIVCICATCHVTAADPELQEAVQVRQKDALEYLQRIERGQIRALADSKHASVTWYMMFDGDRTHVRDRRHLKSPNHNVIGFFNEIISTPKEVISLNDAPDAAIQVNPWELQAQYNPQESVSLQPRFIGTAIVPSLNNMADESPRGVFGEIFHDKSLVLKDGRQDVCDGQEAVVGIYDRPDHYTIELWWATDSPSRLLRAVATVDSPTTTLREQVDLKYREWPCGVTFPQEIVMQSLTGDQVQSKEIVTIDEFSVPAPTVDDFTPLAMDAPDGTPVMYWDKQRNIDYRKIQDGTIVDFTPEDHRKLEDATRLLNADKNAAHLAAGDLKPGSGQGISRSAMIILFTVGLIVVANCLFFFTRRPSEQ
jgi:hypothetical protein